MLMTAALVLSTTLNAPIEDRTVFTKKWEYTEESASGKRYKRSMSMTFVDLNADGKASPIDRRERELGPLLSFIIKEMPEVYEAEFGPQLAGITITSSSSSGPDRVDPRGSAGKTGRKSGSLPQIPAYLDVGEYDNKETFLKAWRQFGAPTIKKARGLAKAAIRDHERAKRAKGRGR